MTTFTQDQVTQKLSEIDERTRQAWITYNDSLRDLEGKDYEDAEDQSWDRLQKRLRELDDERLLVAGN